ncbi:hypothetical protein LCGC14_0383490 [marine sediment metagenome]|uniref:Uncharacterized protein n=1 Tax=marine sediment metagenome TaxID=412755 RepID=A0A0F9T1M0_9ZZZZ
MIFILWGEDKSCKNTLAMTFPKPMVDMEFDIGGLTRASRNLYRPASDGVAELNLPIKDWVTSGQIKLEQYIMPFQIGNLDPITSIVRPSKIIVGMKELFYEFAGKFIGHLKDPDVKTIMVDTGTLLYETTCVGYTQELQEKQLPLRPDGKGQDGKALRTQLQPPEYREPYIRMRGFVYQAKAHGKHLVMTHHAADEYGLMRKSDGTFGQDKTGKRILHGWGQLGDGADVVGHTYWDAKEMKPYFNVELAEVKELEGMVFEEPTFNKISTVIKMLRGEE